MREQDMYMPPGMQSVKHLARSHARTRQLHTLSLTLETLLGKEGESERVSGNVLSLTLFLGNVLSE